MKSFTYHSPVDIRFGEGLTGKIGEILQGQYKKVMLMTAKGPFRANGLHRRIGKSLGSAGISYVESPDIDSNPKMSTIRESVAIAREHDVDAVIAVGGGSAMDSGKTAAAAVAMNVDPWELMWGPRHGLTASLPLITVPTIASTGTEVNEFAVAVDDETHEKSWCLTAHPKIAILDPENTATVPLNLTVWGAMDILSHTFEFYLNDDRQSEIQNRMSEAILLATMDAVSILSENPADLHARGELMWCAVMAWGGLTKIGRGNPDMTCHSIEESFSGYFDTHHGACLGVLTPYWMELVYPHNPGPFARFARNVMKVTEADDRTAAQGGIEKYRQWLRSVDAPQRFSDFGGDTSFDDNGLMTVAENALRIYDGSIGRLKPLTETGEILSLLKAGRGDGAGV